MTDPIVDDPQIESEATPWLEELPPRQIVAELDRFIVGQASAKKAIAIAIRNRWRRARTPDDIRDEITPNNLILIGPTGVGKTEVARRLARLAGAPFLKVEASKFTEVGYVGRDAESMVRDLVDVAITMVRGEREDEVFPQAEARAEDRIIEILLPPAAPPPVRKSGEQEGAVFVVSPSGEAQAETGGPLESERRTETQEKLRKLLRDGKLDDREVEIEVTPQGFPMLEAMQPPQGIEGQDINLTELLQEMLPKRKKRRTARIPEARRILIDARPDRISPGKASSATSCQSWKGRRSRPATVSCAPTTFYSWRRARFTRASRRT